MRYILLVSSTSLTPDEIRAAAATHSELGPEYQAAVIESFLDKVGREIDARVDARVAMAQPVAQMPARRQRSSSGWAHSPFALAVVSLIAGIPLTGIVVGSHTGIAALAIVWVAIAVINIAYVVNNRPPSR